MNQSAARDAAAIIRHVYCRYSMHKAAVAVWLGVSKVVALDVPAVPVLVVGLGDLIA